MHFTPGAALKPRRMLIGSLAGLAFALGATGFAPAQASEATIYTFKGGLDGAWPKGALIADAHGALYGATSAGGSSSSFGTVFKLTPPTVSGGQWTETVLYRFKGGSDGAVPVSNLIFDAKGALYGETYNGGNSQGDGTVFKLTPPTLSGGQWTETVLYRFKGGLSDGALPSGGLIFDAKGALYGTTWSGGNTGLQFGVVFKLTPPALSGGQWTETVLYNFKGGADGAQPTAGLIFDNKGALYGATTSLGAGSGAVFKLTPSSGKNPWAITVLHGFSGTAGGYAPSASLIFDSQGALYGTAQTGGIAHQGVVFKLTPPLPSKSAWTETVLTDFAGASISLPYCSLLFDAKGDLYGTTMNGASAATYGGSVFKLTPPTSGKTGPWALSVAHGFSAIPGKGGAHPYAGLIVGHDGALYGTLFQGGGAASGQGAVFRLQP